MFWVYVEGFELFLKFWIMELFFDNCSWVDVWLKGCIVYYYSLVSLEDSFNVLYDILFFSGLWFWFKEGGGVLRCG